MAPLAGKEQLGDEQGGHHEKRPGNGAAEQPQYQEDGGEGEANGADEAKHREAEHGGGQKHAAQHEMTAVDSLAARLGAARATLRAGTLLLAGRSLAATLAVAVAQTQDTLDKGHRADPRAEGASKQQDERQGDDEADEYTRHERLARKQARKRAHGTDGRDGLPPERRDVAQRHHGDEGNGAHEQHKGRQGATELREAAPALLARLRLVAGALGFGRKSFPVRSGLARGCRLELVAGALGLGVDGSLDLGRLACRHRLGLAAGTLGLPSRYIGPSAVCSLRLVALFLLHGPTPPPPRRRSR